MSRLDPAEDREARIRLASLLDPDQPRLLDLLAHHRPAEALARLAADGRVDLTSDPVAVAASGRSGNSPTERFGDSGQDHRVLVPGDPEWPTGLADLATIASDATTSYGPPPVAALCLWVRGSLPAGPTLATAVTVTGSRAATDYGRYVAGAIAFELVEHGRPVVTSGALGVDAAVLRGALAVPGPAIAVLPGGVDVRYPLANADLLDRVATHGLLLSAFPPGQQPTRNRFLWNARLLAALTSGTVIVEAGLRSRAQLTLDTAHTLGRVMMIVPGPVTSAASRGCHAALRRYPHARLVTDGREVLADLSTLLPVAALRPGDIINLHADAIADPDGARPDHLARLTVRSTWTDDAEGADQVVEFEELSGMTFPITHRVQVINRAPFLAGD